MKKSVLAAIAFSICSVLQAQKIVSKEGHPVLPEKGDWSIGIDATRLIKLANFNFISGAQAITGKYMKDSATAYRAGVRIGVNSWTTRDRSVNRASATSSLITYPAPLPMNDNVWMRNSAMVGLSYGIEKRRGFTRLQGIYGVEGGFFISTSTDKFSYATSLSASPSDPIEVDSADAMTSPVLGQAFNISANPGIVDVDGSARVTERKNGFGFSLGLRAFIGAEYFVLPKLSIGGEFGWGMGFTTTGRTKTTYESIGQTSAGRAVKQSTIDGDVSHHFFFDTDNAGNFGGLSASLKLNLYF